MFLHSAKTYLLMTEEQIIGKAKNRDRAAQTLLYKKYQTSWYVICMRYNKNRHDALDVLQNALINIFSKIDQFDVSKGTFKSWSSQIVVNDNLMCLRKRVSSYKVDQIEAHHEVLDSQESPVDVLSAEELTKMIQKLPSGYRTVFNLYIIEGYSHKEIAKLLDITEGTSKSQLHKAKNMLKKKLEVIL